VLGEPTEDGREANNGSTANLEAIGSAMIVGRTLATADVVVLAVLRIESQIGTELSIRAALDFLDLPLHEVQSEHAFLESIGQTTKERCLIPVLEQVEGCHHGVGLLAGSHVIDERVDRERSKPRERGDSFREESREKQHEIPNMFAYFSLAIERRCFESSDRLRTNRGFTLMPRKWI
jgi:hypothetical protein